MKCGSMRKIVTWEGIHVSTLRSQTVSNNIAQSGHTGTVPVGEVAVGDILCIGNRQTIKLNRNKNPVRLIVI